MATGQNHKTKSREGGKEERREGEKGRSGEAEVSSQTEEKPITHSINVGWMRVYSFVFVFVFVSDKQMPRTFFPSSGGRRAAFKSCVACCLAWCGMIRVSAAHTYTHIHAHTQSVCVCV